jgi:(p)ppGpp synthase/HD superfamily hydrolase
MAIERDDGRPIRPVPPSPWLYSERLIDALRAAAILHAGHARKGTRIPKLMHLLGVCSIALEYGADEDEAIAAVLHDVLEDVEPVDEARATVASFGDEVLRIVDAVTDAPLPVWRDRKAAFLATLPAADGSVLLVAAADKLQNARTIVGEVRRFGQAAWARQSAPPADLCWYYRSLVTAFRANPASEAALIDELDRVVTDLEALVAAEFPGRP